MADQSKVEQWIQDAATAVSGIVLSKLKVEGFNLLVQSSFKKDVARAITSHAPGNLVERDYHKAERYATFLASGALSEPPSATPLMETDYYWKDGSLKWGYPHDVGHLILQLQTLDPKMKVSSVIHIEFKGESRARAYGLSMSRERWDESGWLDWNRGGPECLAIWAQPHEEGTIGVRATASTEIELRDALQELRDFIRRRYKESAFSMDSEAKRLAELAESVLARVPQKEEKP